VTKVVYYYFCFESSLKTVLSDRAADSERCTRLCAHCTSHVSLNNACTVHSACEVSANDWAGRIAS